MMHDRFLRASPSSTSLLPPSGSPASRARSIESSQLHSIDTSTGLTSSGLPMSMSAKYSLSPSPVSWGMPLTIDQREADDYLHNPDPRRDRIHDRGTLVTYRGLANLGCLAILSMGCMMLFVGYPILSHVVKDNKQTTQGGFNLGGTNATGQVPDLPGNWGLIDKDTPREAYTKKTYTTGEEFILVFSDEFNVAGRTFFPGDDPYWEAVDLHYWGTNDLEWYDPGQATTQNGSLQIRLEQVANPVDNHNLGFKSAMLQTWNKFCFTGGLIEASIMLPGSNRVSGLWPAVWTMGNLGRAGYGATVEGLWPYSYDHCDVGTLPNQTYPGTNLPEWAVQGGDGFFDGVLSFQPGQRLSACTCPGESHPGPMRSDGSYVGRAAPEIDIIEATVDAEGGKVSLSAQWAPYNAEYKWLNTSDNLIIYDPAKTVLNTYVGGVYQQTTSGLSLTNQACYELSGGCYALYAFEYKPGFDDAYITWVNDGEKAWTFRGPGMGPDPRVEVNVRPVSFEPMYIIANLGFSNNFGHIDMELLTFPATMSIDYIRIYQPKDAVNIGCDPVDFPTAKYIETYKEAYTNPNFTTWEQYGEPWPRNRLNGGC